MWKFILRYSSLDKSGGLTLPSLQPCRKHGSKWRIYFSPVHNAIKLFSCLSWSICMKQPTGSVKLSHRRIVLYVAVGKDPPPDTHAHSTRVLPSFTALLRGVADILYVQHHHGLHHVYSVCMIVFANSFSIEHAQRPVTHCQLWAHYAHTLISVGSSYACYKLSEAQTLF